MRAPASPQPPSESLVRLVASICRIEPAVLACLERAVQPEGFTCANILGQAAPGAEPVKTAMALHSFYSQWKLWEQPSACLCQLYLRCLDDALFYASSEQQRDTLLAQAAYFAGTELARSPLPPGGMATRLDILRQECRSRSLLGFIRVTSTPFFTSCTLAGLPVYMRKRLPGAPSSPAGSAPRR